LRGSVGLNEVAVWIADTLVPRLTWPGSSHPSAVYGARACEALGQPIVLVGDCQEFRAFGCLAEGLGLLTQASGGASTSARPSLVRVGDFHKHSPS
jgi:hypothetical protein